MAQYVYLFHTKEFFNSHQPIYKIGKTKQPNFNRFKNYPRGSVMLFQSSCHDCDKLEKQIIILFTSRYVRRLGLEYFEGDQSSMIRDMCDIVQNEGVTQDAFVSDARENGDDAANDEVEVPAVPQRLFNCIPCGLSTNNRSNFDRHQLTRKHIDRMQNPDDYVFECIICFKTYDTNRSLRKHNVKCRAPEPIIPTVPAPLEREVDDLGREMSSMCNIRHH